MRTVEATVEILPDGSVHVELAEPLELGTHHGVLMLDENESASRGTGRPSLPPPDLGPELPGQTYRREEIYDDPRL